MDAMRKAYAKDWSISVCYPYADGWNAAGAWSHTEYRNEGRRKMRRAARRRLKNNLKNWSREY
jgi:hypothetical protein